MDQTLPNSTFMDANQSTKNRQKIYIPLVVTGFISGLILSWGLLSGDENGSINLLYVLLLYFFLPVISLIATLISILRRRSAVSIGRLLHTSLFNIQHNPVFRRLRAQKVEQLWLIQQVQLFAMVFSLASLITFFFLLLFTDVSIIWRSTLLDPEDLYPVLHSIAQPWAFWSAAQPDLQLLQATQDFRLQSNELNATALVSWWPFVVAVQVVYGILPRAIIYVALAIRLGRNTQETPVAISAAVDAELVAEKADAQMLATIPGPLELLQWHSIPREHLDKLIAGNSPISRLITEEWRPDIGNLTDLLHEGRPLVVVKSWEAPMGELADQLRQGDGYLLPLNWRGDQLVEPLAIHFDEWGRFCRGVNWQLVKLEANYYE